MKIEENRRKVSITQLKKIKELRSLTEEELDGVREYLYQFSNLCYKIYINEKK